MNIKSYLRDYDINAGNGQDWAGIESALLRSAERSKQSALTTQPRWNFSNRKKGKYIDI